MLFLGLLSEKPLPPLCICVVYFPRCEAKSYFLSLSELLRRQAERGERGENVEDDESVEDEENEWTDEIEDSEDEMDLSRLQI
jgi:hypothetical protein